MKYGRGGVGQPAHRVRRSLFDLAPPSKSRPIQTPEGRSRAITPVIDRSAHHSGGRRMKDAARRCQEFVAEGDDLAAD
ncbi:hypothetical protein VZT92_027793 [Zoarces viviparus]|uniref:Uncharacterized protein n=1 Tax=Zoarces viviparus TaxID=48416 RepID=A0AAW1DX86_ZOAVI